MNDHHVDEERTEEVDLMTSNPRRSARLGSRSSSCSSTPVLGGAGITAKMQALDGAQQMNDERAQSSNSCVKLEQSSCKEVFTSHLVESGCAAGSTAPAQDTSASAPSTFPLLAGSPVTISGEVFYEGNDMLVVRVNWRGWEFTGTLIKQGKGHWAPTKMRMLEEVEAEAEISQERPEEPLARTRKRRGPRARDKGNGEEKSSPGRPASRKRGRAARAKKEEEEEEEDEQEEGDEEPELKSKGSEQGDSNGEDYKVSNTAQQSLPGLRSKKRSPETLTPTPTKELMNAYQTSPPDSSKAESPSEPPEYFECPEPECPRKYKHMKSLKHHLACAHQGIRRPSLKRKLVGAMGHYTEDEERKTDEAMQSPASKKVKSCLSKDLPHKGKMISSQTECGSGNSEKEDQEQHGEIKNRISEDAKRSGKTKQRQTARRWLKQQAQSEEDDKREDGECGGSGQETPSPVKDTTHTGQQNKEEGGKKDDISAVSSIAHQPRFCQTLGFGNNFTVVNNPTTRSVMSGSSSKGILSAALKISNNQIHGRDGASEDTNEAQQGHPLHSSSLTPAIGRMTVGQTPANNTTHLLTEWSKAFPSGRDMGETMGSSQPSSLAGGSRSPSNVMRKNRLNNSMADKSPTKSDSSAATQNGAEILARLSKSNVLGQKTDNQRVKVEHNFSDIPLIGSLPFSAGMEGHLPRNGSTAFGHLSSSKDQQQAMPLISSNPRDHPLGMAGFPPPFTFFPSEMFGGFPNFSNYSLGRDISVPMGLGGINSISSASDLNMRASIAAELNKARGGNT